MRVWVLALAAVVAMAGCRAWLGKESASSELDLENTLRDSEKHVRETRTLSGLAEMETALDSFVNKHERRIPDKLDELIPKYLAEIPYVDVPVAGHQENSEVKYYPSDVLRGGQIDGSKLRDTGRWGYVHNDRQAVIFVDCTHPSSRGRPWYQERGAH